MATLVGDVDLSNIEPSTLCKMVFLFNALQDGWSVKRRKESYVFTKKHENRKEVFTDGYLKTFLESNSSIK